MQYKMLSTSINKIELDNRLQIEGQINLSANYHTEIAVDPENNRQVAAIAYFDLSGASGDSDDSILELNLVFSGVFETDVAIEDPDDIKNDLHGEMFPYLRAYISAITSLSGLPPITLPDMSIVS